MNEKVNELTVDELKDLISNVVQEKLDDMLEDVKLMLDSEYVNSIKEARKEYKQGKVTSIDDILST
ncbi:MAG: hypothetical protein HY965_04970 [Ignavibacteriales bacterium]|nr:hypothetical protein [Ignavibacteriales bacterium]